MKFRSMALLVAIGGGSLVPVLAPGADAAPAKRSVTFAAATPSGGRGESGAAATRAKAGALPKDPASLAASKASAERSLPGATSAGAVSPSTATVTTNFEGIFQGNSTPSDSTGAVGLTRYIELVNTDFAIYSKTSSVPLSTGTLNALVGASAADSVFDPQVIWDPGTKRFYYAADQVVSAVDNRVALGFSKTATPSSAADFCQYVVGFGSNFPDYPKLGDSKDFWLVGVNVFSGAGSFVGADAFGLSKPPAGTTCPAASTFKFGLTSNLKDSGGGSTFTPVPGNQIDTAAAGFIVSRSGAIPSAGATILSVFKVTKNIDGTPNIPVTGTSVVVPAYKVPPNAKQQGATQLIDTSDTRPTQAILALDPRLGKTALWTQHTVLGGAGAEVRWYEIDPIAHTLLQSGTVTSATLFSFNGAISPDRVVKGTTKAFGDSMVLNFNTSSSTTFSAIKVVSKVGAGAQTAPVLIKQSPGPDKDFACTGSTSVCRWGDYAAATPDPAASPTGAVGLVWGTSQWNINSVSTGQANWRTENFAVAP